MSYFTQSKMAQDYGLIMRIAACAASEDVSLNPTSWADTHRQRLVASPGWDTKYESAIASGVEAPGEDEAVITDADILAAVQLLAESLTPPPEPTSESSTGGSDQ